MAESQSETRSSRRYIPLFWRLFIPNAAVLTAACVVLIIQPANGRILVLGAGLVIMLLANLVLMRSATAPLARLMEVMRSIDPLQPGQRIPVDGPESETSLLAEAFNDMLDRLETERRDSARREVAAQEAERRHVAAELHDDIGQNLTALQLLLGRGVSQAPPDLEAPLREARDLTELLVEDVRRLARRLRPEVLDALGLPAALTNLCERMSVNSGVRIVCRISPGLPPLAPEADLVVYRIAQESLTNVVRHADAHEAQLTLEPSRSGVALTVRDDGCGPSRSDGSGTGIRGMRERALLVGGRLEIDQHPGEGTTVRLGVPAFNGGRPAR